MSWWTPDRQAYAVNYLVASGLSPWGAAALVARWAYVEASAGPTSRGGYRGRAWGIAQWLGPRLPPIDGNPNFDDQLAYVVEELQRPESYNTGRAYQLLQTAQDADTGAVGASLYERAGGFNSATGRDDYTSRTASRAPSVLQAWQSQYTTSPSSLPVLGAGANEISYVDGLSYAPDVSSAGIGIGGAVAIGAGVLLLILILDL